MSSYKRFSDYDIFGYDIQGEYKDGLGYYVYDLMPTKINITFPESDNVNLLAWMDAPTPENLLVEENF